MLARDSIYMKHRDLISILTKHGFVLARAIEHEVWTNGVKTLTVPRQKDINRFLAKRILKQAGIELN